MKARFFWRFCCAESTPQTWSKGKQIQVEIAKSPFQYSVQVCTICNLENKLTLFHFEILLFKWPRDPKIAYHFECVIKLDLNFIFWTFHHWKMSNKSCFGMSECDYAKLFLRLFQVQFVQFKLSIPIWLPILKNWDFFKSCWSGRKLTIRYNALRAC